MSLRVLNILGQRPDATGSGIFVREILRATREAGDIPALLCATYPEDDFQSELGAQVFQVKCGTEDGNGAYRGLIPGMSDAMPYRSARYSSLSSDAVASYCDAFASQLEIALKEFRPDIIHLHHLWALSSLTNRHPDLPWVVTLHGTDLKQATLAPQHRGFVEDALPAFRHFFSVSRDIAEDALRLHSVDPNRMSVVGNGFNPQLFSPTPHAHASQLVPIVLCVGKFVDWKGFAHAIRASSRIRAPHKLVILGTGPEEQRMSLDSLVSDLGLTNRVCFPGHLPQKDVADWMRSAAVFVLPSLHEPFGLVLLEAIACGCPPIAANSGGPRDIITREMSSMDLASLVSPMEPTPEGARNYESDLAAAIEHRLNLPLSVDQRVHLSSLVQHRSWHAVYSRQRAVYAQIC